MSKLLGILLIYTGILGFLYADGLDDDAVARLIQSMNDKSTGSETSEGDVRTYGNPDEDPSKRIIGGSKAKPGDHPWQILLTFNGYFSCGGVIINSKTVLTAAHCVEGDEDEPELFRAYAGVTDIKEDIKDAQSSSAKKIRIHPKYNPNYLAFDFAIIHLEKALIFNSLVSPADNFATKQNENTFYNNDNCYVTGYGVRTDAPEFKFSWLLRELQVDLVSTDKCRRYVKYRYDLDWVKNSMTCTLDTHGTDCYGDSGGPVGCFNPRTGEYTLVGLVSFGPKWKCLAPPSIYARISRARGWIMNEAKRY